MGTPRRWDLFCRVIDNFGDIGVCWRLAADLARRGEQVRLWADDLSALRWMAPGGAAGVEVLPWDDPLSGSGGSRATVFEPGDVVIEAFACDLPPDVVAAMARRSTPPVWINLEYLSAESWVERCHGLPSPRLVEPGRGLTKWFFHPGFTASTGGLIREPDLLQRQTDFDAPAWRQAHGLELRQGERLVSMFCYEIPRMADALSTWADGPTLWALTPGQARDEVHRRPLPPGVRTVDLPWLSQRDFDHLLWSADLNLVRGEDSLVRAIWAGKPFVWQPYRQQDEAHLGKMKAFLARWGVLAQWEVAPSHSAHGLAASVTALWANWNGLAETATHRAASPPDTLAWVEAAQRARDALWAQPDLSTLLLRFIDVKSRV